MVIIYAESDNVFRRLSGSMAAKPRRVRSREELAAEVVHGPGPDCVLVQLATVQPSWQRFLSALKRSFGLLEVCLTVDDAEADIPGVRVLTAEQLRDGGALARLLKSFRKNRRRRQRFDWPLQGRLTAPHVLDERFSVRSISASGAFLSTPPPAPPEGSTGSIRIEFHDFYLYADCRILASRPAAGNLPAGFGIEFRDVTGPSEDVIDRIVADELLRSILQPDQPPNPPAIAGAPARD